jgi:hypothetical protein
MLVVEFFGLPGAGKTTLADALGRHLQEEGRVCIYRRLVLADDRRAAARHLLRARFVVYGTLRHPTLFGSAMRLVRDSRQTSMRDAAKVLWNLSCVLGFWLWCRKTDADVVLVDQGVLQALWSVAFASRGAGEFRPFLERLVTDDIRFIHVVTEPADADARLGARTSGTTRIAGDVAARSDAWVRGQAALDQVLGALEGIVPPESVLRISNPQGTDAERRGEDIAGWLRCR